MTLKNKLVVSASPHDRSPRTVRSLMLDVIIALIPALIASVIFYGPRALLIECVSVATCVIFEYITRIVFKRSQSIGDLSAVITGLLLAFNLPVSIPLWMVVIGSLVAIVVAKQFFGGIGQNFANPAITARIVLMLSFGGYMSTWAAPFWYKTGTIDAVTTATPLAMDSGLPSYLDMFLGVRGGCIGETCALTLLLGGIYLLVRRVISFHIPVAFLGSLFVLSLFVAPDGVNLFTFALSQVLSGGAMLGAIFMATDYVTSPCTKLGKLIFGLGCAVITFLIRNWASSAEGVSFSILIMNILTPHINNLTAIKPLGGIKAKSVKV